uniref:Uncharacterized protein n=1 Tax=Electrophorus electricus TaxID=8005 RepID=A0AAY5EWD9_ELEEL
MLDLLQTREEELNLSCSDYVPGKPQNPGGTTNTLGKHENSPRTLGYRWRRRKGEEREAESCLLLSVISFSVS